MKLTIGMPHHSDYTGVWMTVQDLRLHHPSTDYEILVVDNSPDNWHGEQVASFVQRCSDKNVRYVAMRDAVGTAAAKNAVFENAKGEYVLMIDCHILFPSGVIDRLLKFLPSIGSDLYTGPLLLNSFRDEETHFDLKWRGKMWGVWAKAWKSPEGVYFSTGNDNGKLVCYALDSNRTEIKIPNAPENYAMHHRVLIDRGFVKACDTEEPFEIPAQGCGLMLCRKDSWLGFNKEFRGFGGEEGYIHEKYRKHGRKVYCLPWLKWVHRFGSPDEKRGYVNSYEDRFRNYHIGLTELGIPLDDLRREFEGVNMKVVESKPVKKCSGSCRTGEKPIPPSVVKIDYNHHEHLAVGIHNWEGIKKWAERCPNIFEASNDPVSLSTLLVPGAKIMHMPRDKAYLDILYPIAKSRKISLDTFEGHLREVDMLFIDHEFVDAEKFRIEINTALGPYAKKVIFINKIKPAIKKSKWILGEIKTMCDNGWFIADYSDRKNGYIVLSKVNEFRPEKPIYLWPIDKGAGTELKKILGFFGFKTTATCSCNARANKMDVEGPDWCDENFDMILGWLREEGLKRWHKKLKSWKNDKFFVGKAVSKLYNIVEPSMSKVVTPMINIFLRSFLKRAIKRSRV